MNLSDPVHPSLAAEQSVPGRSCPLHYRYRPEHVAAVTPAFRCEALYVVGGLYGNVPALEQVLWLFEQEPARDKRLVFNGDFHWFDSDPAAFRRVAREVMRFDAVRGNVETEIADPQADESAGCGCGYPDWVGDGVVERSNRIIGRLRETARGLPGHCEWLRALPMWLRLEVAGCRVGIVHGDAHSLAGWDFADEALNDPAHRARVRDDFDRAEVDVYASTHTCVPVLHRWGGGDRTARVLVNNGAAGMPNLARSREGLLTRIAKQPLHDPGSRRSGLECGPVVIDLVAISYDDKRWQQEFLAAWPPGSDAYASYADRIMHGGSLPIAKLGSRDPSVPGEVA